MAVAPVRSFLQSETKSLKGLQASNGVKQVQLVTRYQKSVERVDGSDATLQTNTLCHVCRSFAKLLKGHTILIGTYLSWYITTACQLSTSTTEYIL